uniref:Uncharacterized protein n=1 Tax=Glossina morsitans morsitans TaxID=37546 RepID=A0A1B0FEF0_GLOMM
MTTAAAFPRACDSQPPCINCYFCHISHVYHCHRITFQDVKLVHIPRNYHDQFTNKRAKVAVHIYIVVCEAAFSGEFGELFMQVGFSNRVVRSVLERRCIKKSQREAVKNNNLVRLQSCH